MSTCTLHTTGNLRNAVVVDKSSEAANCPAVNLLDRNPISYWMPDYATETPSGTPWVKIDFGSVKQVDNVFLLLRNYSAQMYPDISEACVLQWSNDGTTFTTFWSPLTGDSTTGVGNPIYGGEFTTTPLTPVTKRYWRYIQSAYSFPTLIAGIYLVRSWPLTYTPAVQSSRSIIPTVTSIGGSGTQFTRPIRSSATEVYQWSFVFGQTDRDNFVAAFNDCHGSEWPFLYQEGTSVQGLKLMRFTSDELTEKRIGQSIYEISCEVQDVSIYREGETF